MKKLLSIFLVVILFTAIPFAHAQKHPITNGPPIIHNGLWWKEKSGLFKEAFLGGYKAGTLHTVGHPVDVNKFPASELIEGLDHFYKDFRNQNIVIDDSLTYIVEQLRGVPDDKLAAELQKMRQAAAPPASDE